MAALKVLGVMLAFGSILFLSVIFTRLLAGKTKRAMKGQYINIIETVSLGLDKQLHLIRIDNQFVLIATAGKSVEFLSNIDIDNFTEEEMSSSGQSAFDFKALFEKYVQVYKDKRTGKSLDNSTKGETFKGNLSRMRNITGVMYRQGEIDGDEGTNEK
jgi:flagellar protein FliO/FliZ